MHRATQIRSIVVAATLLVSGTLLQSRPVLAQSTDATTVEPAAQDSTSFDRTEVMIQMRDGVKLHTLVFSPKNAAEPLPIIMTRTPYGIAGSGRQLHTPAWSDLEHDGYILVFQDIRGRYESGGKFVMLRTMRNKRDPKSIDESTDAYDTIAWLLKHVANNNGRVGMTGTSYPGWLTVMAMLDPHPALKAAAPKASPVDMFIGDDFHHNGAFRLSYGFEYATMMETTNENSAFSFDKPDLYDWYLGLGSLAHVNERYLHGKIPTWNDFVAHPNDDAFWQRQTALPYLDRVTVPTLNVAGWWDQEDFYGAVRIYEALEQHDTKNMNFLVAGPWNHGGWGAATGEKLGAIDFGSATSIYYRMNIEAPFFAHWLKDRQTSKLAEATTFQSGSDKWESYDTWPPRGATATPRRLYFHPDHTLSFAAPTEASANAFDSYVSDPANPVPYRKRPILATYGPGSTWYTWLLDDQRFAETRPDVVSWQTAPLAQDVVIAGNVAAHLFASTTGSDADWVVKLIDVYPETESDSKMRGYELMVANDVFRGRFRKSFVHPAPITPNHVDEYTVDMHTQDYRFLKGHRIMVQVQSSWFPLIDRNPQTFVPNIFDAKDSDFRKATQHIFRSRNNPSNVEVSIMTDTTRRRITQIMRSPARVTRSMN